MVRLEMQQLRTEVESFARELRGEMETLGLELRAEMEILRRDLTIRLGGMIVVATGILLVAKIFG